MDVGSEISFEVVVARHSVRLAALLAYTIGRGTGLVRNS
jgi:hypothetical protein